MFLTSSLQALLENMLVELPFASFFLAKILSHSSANLDIHHLQSLDPIMYKYVAFTLIALNASGCQLIIFLLQFISEKYSNMDII